MSIIITKHLIAEQVKRLLKGGDPSVASRVHGAEIKMAIGQVINQLLKVEYFSITLPNGETIPEGAVLATYDNVPVVTYKNVSKSVLPAMPVKLIRNMGVYHIGETDDVHCGYIPIQPGQFMFIKEQQLISTILDQVGYEVSGTDIIYTEDLTAASPAITEVMMKLVIMDIGEYTDYQMLPISADMQWTVIQEVFKMFSAEGIPDRTVDSGAENK